MTSETDGAIPAPVRGAGGRWGTNEERWAKAREMAGAGYTSRQIAASLGVEDVPGLTRRLKERGIAVPANRVVTNTHRLDSNRIVDQIVADCDGIVSHLALADPEALDKSRVGEWAKSMGKSARAIALFVRQLKDQASQPPTGDTE